MATGKNSQKNLYTERKNAGCKRATLKMKASESVE